MQVLTNFSGNPLTSHRASEGLRQWCDKKRVEPWEVGRKKRLQDVVELLRRDFSMPGSHLLNLQITWVGLSVMQSA